MKAYQVMSHPVVSVRADTTVDEIAHLLVTHRISSVPVVNEENQVIGIVSESDLFLKEKGIPFSAVKLPALFKRWVGPNQLAEIYADAHQHTATDVMTSDVVCADAEEHIENIASQMLQRDLKRVPILRDGKLVGILSRVDLIRALVKAR